MSLIITVLNEEQTITKFLESLFLQSQFPNEIIIVDGGSTDNTVVSIKNYASRIKNKKIKLSVFIKHGNRSVGRNQAILHTKEDIIASTDAGCILDKDWVKQITQPFVDSSVDAVAGYYEAKTQTVFQKCLVPYVLVMQDNINPKNFLPASRSMAFTKKIWEKAGKFPEGFSHNEDYVFAKKLKKIGAKIVFQKNAIVYWIPRSNFKEAYTMFFRFAFGDAESMIIRPKVLLVFTRYILGIMLFIVAYMSSSYILLYGLIFLFIIYIIWSIVKNYRYVKKLPAIFILPILQLSSDNAVLWGTLFGTIKRLYENYKS